MIQKFTNNLLRLLGVAIMSFVFAVAEVSAQTATTTPGTPTTALGGASASNIVMLVIALALIVLGLFTLFGRNKTSARAK